MDEAEKREIRSIVSKYKMPHDRKVIRQIMETGRVNKRALIKDGIPRERILKCFAKLRERLKDYGTDE